MEILNTSFEDARKLSATGGQEGIVCLGTGGDLRDWVNGLTELMQDEKITEGPATWLSCHSLMTTGARSDLLLVFDLDKFDLGRMAMWRLRFGDCSWLSDYVVNYADQHGEVS